MFKSCGKQVSFIALCWLGTFTVCAYSQENQALYRSAHYLGRGDTGIASTDDHEAIFYNPAGLAQGTGIYKRIIIASPTVEVSKNAYNVYKQMQIEGKDQTEILRDQVGEPTHFGLNNLSAIVFRRAAVGVLFSGGINTLVKKSPEYGGLETLNAGYNSNQVVTFSLAERFWKERLHVGTTLKYIKRNEASIEASLADAESFKDLASSDTLGSGSTSAADFGLLLKSGKNVRSAEAAWGLTLQNAGQAKFSAEQGEVKTFRQVVNTGVAFDFGTKLSRMRLLADYRDIGGVLTDSVYKRTHLGAELSVVSMVGVTVGLNQGYATYGSYLDLYLFRLDAAVYTEEVGDRVGTYPDTRYIIRLTAGL